MLLTKSQCESVLKLAAFNNHWWAVADKEILAYLKDHENISVETIREIVLAHPDLEYMSRDAILNVDSCVSNLLMGCG